MNKVLIITYYWPPGGGAGVQRWLKFAKYLPQSGWDPIVLTVDPHYASYPAIDNSLIGEIPEGIKVVRTRATDWFRVYGKSKVPAAGFAKNNDNKLSGKISRFIRGNFFIPDPRRGWNRYAFSKACELINNEGIENIITTSPPHSTQLIGKNLKRKFPHLKWIADLRDPWTDIYYYRKFYPTAIARAIDAGYEKQTLKMADRIITVGHSLKELIASKLPGISDKTDVIFNGYDPDDFSGLSPEKQDLFTISYTGTISGAYPLTGFLSALNSMKGKREGFRLRFTGDVPAQQKDEIIKSTGFANVEFNSYADHRTAIRNMLRSSLLLLIIPNHESSKSIITGKIFEYMATGLPVLCLGPVDGDAAGLLNDYGNGKTFLWDDTAGILQYLETIRSGILPANKRPDDIFRRDIQVKKIVSLLEMPL